MKKDELIEDLKGIAVLVVLGAIALFVFISSYNVKRVDAVITAMTGKPVHHDVPVDKCYDLASCMEYEHQKRLASEGR